MMKGRVKQVLTMSAVLCVGAFLYGLSDMKHTKQLPTDGLPAEQEQGMCLTEEDSTCSEYRVKLTENQDSVTNLISDPNGTMAAIYEKMLRLKRKKKGDTTTLSIVHIGDSHLQAGFLNGTVMKLLQHEFGNAGRGLVFPLKLANTNEPTDYFIESQQRWTVARCVTKELAFPVGLGGLSIQTNQSRFSLRVGAENRDNIDYSFNKVKVFHHPKLPAIRVDSALSSSDGLRRIAPFMTEVHLPASVRSLDLVSAEKQAGDSSIIYGFSLENSQCGVIYHAIGINAARWSSFLRVDDFACQIKTLQPDLIIFSLGTNEAFNKTINRRVFTATIDKLVSGLVQEIPDAKILISTPAECQKRYSEYGGEFRPNDLIPTVSEVLLDYSRQKGYPYWDLFEITGGVNSSSWWIKNNYLAKDRVHFYVAGYKYQGELLYKAIVNGYNDYVSNRH